MEKLKKILFLTTAVALSKFSFAQSDSGDFDGFNIHTQKHMAVIYPNPVKGNYFTIKTNSIEKIEFVELSNTIGNKIATKSDKEGYYGDVYFQLPKVSSGIYYVKIKFEDGKYLNKKIIVE